MTNNDLLRSLRYVFKLSDKQMLTLFCSHPHSVAVMAPKQLSEKMADDEADNFSELSDDELTAFLDGLIVSRRGLKDGAPTPVRQERLSRNDVLKKLRIALEFKEQDMLETLEAGGTKLSKGELSAFFRKPDHKHYRQVGNQAMRAFLRGLSKRGVKSLVAKQ